MVVHPGNSDRGPVVSRRAVLIGGGGAGAAGLVTSLHAAHRDAGYSAWTSAVSDNGGAGDQFWPLTSRIDDGSFYPDYDGYRIYWFNDPGNSSNSTAHLLSAHAKALASA